MATVKQIKTNKPVNNTVIEKSKFITPYFTNENETRDKRYLTIKDLLTSSGIDIEDGIDIEYTDKNRDIDDISLSAPTTLEYCCGISEIGDLRCSKNFPINDLTTILDSIINEDAKGHTYIINTNGTDSSVYYEQALTKCKNWVLVKTFINKSSKNTIKMWVSNND